MRNKINLTLIVFITLFGVLPFTSLAQSQNYIRTPAGPEIELGETINFSDFYTFNSNVSSIRIQIDSIYSTCVDTPTSDEQEIDIDVSNLNLGNYNTVSIIGYLSANNCSGSNESHVLENGTPAFSIVRTPIEDSIKRIADTAESTASIFLFFFILFGIIKTIWKS